MSLCRRPRRLVERSASAVRASVPPAPRLSARMITMTYLNVTTTVSAQAINDSTPRTLASLTPPAPARHCFTV